MIRLLECDFKELLQKGSKFTYFESSKVITSVKWPKNENFIFLRKKYHLKHYQIYCPTVLFMRSLSPSTIAPNEFTYCENQFDFNSKIVLLSFYGPDSTRKNILHHL